MLGWLPALALCVQSAAAAPVPGSGVPPGQDSARAAEARPGASKSLLARLGEEIADLGARVKWRGWVVCHGERVPHPVLLLGDGFAAGPFAARLEAPATGTFFFGHDRYRVVVIGSDPPFVTYYRLRDWDHVAGLPTPEEAANPHRKRGDEGVLTVVVGPRGAARLSFLAVHGTARRRRSPPAGAVRRRSARPADSRMLRRMAYLLADSESPPGSVVLHPSGRLLGLLVRPVFARERRSGAGAPAAPARRPARSRPAVPPRGPGDIDGDRSRRSGGTGRRGAGGSRRRWVFAGDGPFAFVLDPWVLKERARRWYAKTKALPRRPMLGLSVVDAETFGRWSRRRSRARKEPDHAASRAAGGLVVISLYRGAPAMRAGIELLDRLIQVNGVTLHATSTLREILQDCRPGERIKLKVRRGGRVLDLVVPLD